MRISGGRPRVGRPDDRTARSSAPLNAARRTERAAPLTRDEREKRRRFEKLRATQFFSSDELQRGRLCGALTHTLGVRATVVSFMPVAHGRAESHTTSAVVRCHKMKILSRKMNVPKKCNKPAARPSPPHPHATERRQPTLGTAVLGRSDCDWEHQVLKAVA